mgnify:CR=1 FL=1
MMREDTVYNQPDNRVMIRTNGNEIHVICNSEEQMNEVVQRMQRPTCTLAGYEEWDKDDDKKWILTFLVSDEETKLELN